MSKENYTVDTFVTKGYSSEVYRVRKGDEVFAAKILQERFSTEEKWIMPFRDEAMQLMAHEHPGLVKCFDFGIAEKRPFSILEWLDGGTLAQVLKRKKSMSVADSLQTALSICDGLLFLQENGLHHEDLKTTDVMWLTSNKVKLIDLGRRRSIGHLNETAPLGELSAPILLIPRRKCWRVSTPTY